MAPHTLPTVLVLSPDKDRRARFDTALSEEFDCLTAADYAGARRALGDNFVQVLITEPICGHPDGRAFLATLHETWPETVRLVLGADTSTTTPDHDVFQLIPETIAPNALRLAVRNATRHFQLARENDRLGLELRCLDKNAESRQQSLRATLMEGPGFETVLRAPDSPMNAVVAAARQYASFDVPVLLTGEDGTGKGDLARAMHYGSLRSDHSFFTFDCSGLTDDVLRLELFGARNGSVPNGHRNKIGLFQKADRGTLYLGSIESLSAPMQKMVLRVLTEGAFQPVGGHETVSTRVRLIAGTTVDLGACVAEGRFRSDLLHAVSVATLTLPPLRVRTVDIPHLAQKMLFDAAADHAKPVHGISDAALAFLSAYDWPGNMRELGNEMTRMLIFSQERLLGPDLISRHILQADPDTDTHDHTEDAVMAGEGTLKDRVEQIEARILRETLTRLKWNKSRAAGELGLSRVGLRAKLDRYRVTPPEVETELEEG
ncbi:MAG: sigma 54-interacting transcriptional regulator [Pseudomonadota bacterium]